jgi:predicted NUDIX family NTP pyrophosphohydrolase
VRQGELMERLLQVGGMAKHSAGILMFRRKHGTLEVLLVHPGGPFWASKDDGAWSIPKGEYPPEEDPREAARREFKEETGLDAGGPLLELAAIRQRGKDIKAWAFEGDCDPAAVKSNAFSMEWPPHSGLYQAFPEVDRAAWFGIEEAKRKILRTQIGFLLDLAHTLKGGAC